MISCLFRKGDLYLEWSDVSLKPSTDWLSLEAMKKYFIRVHCFGEEESWFDTWFADEISKAIDVNDRQEVEELIKYACDWDDSPFTYEKLLSYQKPIRS